MCDECMNMCEQCINNMFPNIEGWKRTLHSREQVDNDGNRHRRVRVTFRRDIEPTVPYLENKNETDKKVHVIEDIKDDGDDEVVVVTPDPRPKPVIINLTNDPDIQRTPGGGYHTRWESY